jgi:hypothetical protein
MRRYSLVDYRKVGKVYVGSIKFDSAKEANRYSELKLLEYAGKIRDLELQPRYELLATFKKNGKTYRAITYIADFAYWDNDKKRHVVEDTKGFKTEVFKIKHKLFEHKYPDKTLDIV